MQQVNTTTGWSCNFENGLCDGWQTKAEILKLVIFRTF